MIKHRATLNNKEGTRILAWHPGSRHLAVSGGGHYNTIWDTRTNKIVRRLPKPDKDVDEMAYSPDGKYLITRDPWPDGIKQEFINGGNFALWSVADNYQLVDNSKPFVATRQIYPAPGNRIFCKTMTVGPGPHPKDRAKIAFFDIPEMTQHDYHKGNISKPDQFAFSPDGRYFIDSYYQLTSSTDYGAVLNNVRLWKHPEMALLWDIKTPFPGYEVVELKFSLDGDTIAIVFGKSGDSTFIIKLFHSKDGSFIRDVTTIDVNPWRFYLFDDKHILIVDLNREIYILDVTNGKKLDSYQVPEDRYSWEASLSPDKKTLAFGKKSKVLLFDIDIAR